MLLATLAVSVTACGGNEGAPGTDTGVIVIDAADDRAADAGPDVAEEEHADVGTDEDVLVIGDVGAPMQFEQRCDGKMADEWPFHRVVSSGAVTVTDEGEYLQASIDASAGGFGNAIDNPFVYVDLDAPDKVAIDDYGSWEDTTWDLAFKRTVIRSNSADSGPGGVRVAKIADTSFEQATMPPVNDSAWASDVSMDEQCEVILDPIGQPFTAFNVLNADPSSSTQSWYTYGSGGASGVAPVEGDVYFVESTEQVRYRLEIMSWDSGVYTLRWAALQ